MIDESYDRAYREGRDTLNASLGNAIARFAGSMRNVFVVLNRIEYRAPWDRHLRRVRGNS
jgi:hypothetical protein